MQEWEFGGDVVVGSSGYPARRVQEWLTLSGIGVMVDGLFGPATAAAVRVFQDREGLPVTGQVDQSTFERLVAPMTNAMRQIPDATAPLGPLVVAYALQHLQQAPREVGGQNRGPWVRLYMGGNEGVAWPWCAGFVTFILRQAAATLGTPLPFEPSYSCDLLAAHARTKKLFVGESQPPKRDRILPGSLFVVRRAVGDWDHTGIVVGADADAIRTIEGNTNDSGEREGYEVLARVRGYTGKDFLLLG